MTQNQIAYMRGVEEARHNVEQESSTRAQIRESQRHNVAQERLTFDTLLETGRHNRASEQLSQQANEELARHNIAQESNVRSQIASNERIAANNAAISLFTSSAHNAATLEAARINQRTALTVSSRSNATNIAIANANNATKKYVTERQGQITMGNTALKSLGDIGGSFISTLTHAKVRSVNVLAKGKK